MGRLSRRRASDSRCALSYRELEPNHRIRESSECVTPLGTGNVWISPQFRLAPNRSDSVSPTVRLGPPGSANPNGDDARLGRESLELDQPDKKKPGLRGCRPGFSELVTLRSHQITTADRPGQPGQNHHIDLDELPHFPCYYPFCPLLSCSWGNSPGQALFVTRVLPWRIF